MSFITLLTIRMKKKNRRNILLFLYQFELLFPLHLLDDNLSLERLRMCIPSLAMYENTRSTSTSIFCTEIRAIVFYEATNNIGGDASIEGMISTTEDIESIRHIRDLLAYEWGSRAQSWEWRVKTMQVSSEDLPMSTWLIDSDKSTHSLRSRYSQQTK